MRVNKTYAGAGVDVAAGYRSVELIKGHVRGTFGPQVLSDIGGFGGLFSLAEIKNMDDPVMVSGTDGVGTKLSLAFMMGKHDTVGIDCVAMSVNDIVCSGAKPLFFLDYIACGRNVPERIEQIVKGVAEGCRQAGAALVGGETAEHSGMMPEDEYDLAGFAAGIVEKRDIIDGKNIDKGDVLVGLASDGVHSNGYSLVRKIFGLEEGDGACLGRYIRELGQTLGEALLTPTRIYVRPVLSLLNSVKVKGIAHITGGGFHENIPRFLPAGLGARLMLKNFPEPPIFGLIAQEGGIDRDDMYNTFNMGLGMVLCVSADDAQRALGTLAAAGERAYIVGEVVEGAGICLE